MFRTFATILPNGARDLVQFHPSELTALLELAWNSRLNAPPPVEFGDPRKRSNISGAPPAWLNALLNAPNLPGGVTAIRDAIRRASGAAPSLMWDHLIYAYMIENTRIYDIFQLVVRDLALGEKLGIARPETQLWLRNTEELFYRDPAPFGILAVTSYVRPDLQASRRNAYHRLFGMDLNHGTQDNKPYAYPRAEAANNEFISTFEELLREVWVGISNVNNTSGSNPTDDGKIADLASKLFEMLRARRQHGALSREEFVFVSMLSWFHMTVETNLPIIEDLRAEAASPEQRLFRIAERVGLPAHGLSKSYFDIASPISSILLQVEQGDFNSRAAVPALYTPAPGGPEEQMRTIINHWSIITGRDIKARKVAST